MSDYQKFVNDFQRSLNENTLIEIAIYSCVETEIDKQMFNQLLEERPPIIAVHHKAGARTIMIKQLWELGYTPFTVHNYKSTLTVWQKYHSKIRGLILHLDTEYEIKLHNGGELTSILLIDRIREYHDGKVLPIYLTGYQNFGFEGNQSLLKVHQALWAGNLTTGDLTTWMEFEKILEKYKFGLMPEDIERRKEVSFSPGALTEGYMIVNAKHTERGGRSQSHSSNKEKF